MLRGVFSKTPTDAPTDAAWRYGGWRLSTPGAEVFGRDMVGQHSPLILPLAVGKRRVACCVLRGVAASSRTSYIKTDASRKL